MGLCSSNPMRTEDREQEKIARFVRCAVTADVAKLQEMLKREKINPNAKDRFGMTAVHWASYVGTLECVKELIKAGGRPKPPIPTDAMHFTMLAAKIRTRWCGIWSASPKWMSILEVKTKIHRYTKQQGKTPLDELETAISTPTTENYGSNLVMSARLSSPQRETHSESRAADAKLDFIGLALQSRQGSRYIERTDVKNYSRSRRSIDEGLISPTTINEEPAQWASSTKPTAKVTDLYRPSSARESAETQKDLKYAGKRVIMAMRVKKALPDVEKMQLIRLLLEKYSTKPAPLKEITREK